MLQDSLLKTKLHIPPARSELVSRPRLIEQYWHNRTGGACPEQSEGIMQTRT